MRLKIYQKDGPTFYLNAKSIEDKQTYVVVREEDPQVESFNLNIRVLYKGLYVVEKADEPCSSMAD